MNNAPQWQPITPENQRPTIVCLCGSTRFMDAFQQANLTETIAGRIVLSIGCNTKCDADLIALGELTADAKECLDELHKRKIDLADEVLILNVGGYVGQSTRSELQYAREHGKRVRWLEAPKPPPAEPGHFTKVVSAMIETACEDTDQPTAQTSLPDFGSNGGVQCDTGNGPCACGAWHQPEQPAATGTPDHTVAPDGKPWPSLLPSGKVFKFENDPAFFGSCGRNESVQPAPDAGTPRTDKAEFFVATTAKQSPDEGGMFVTSNFARQLETDLNAARATIENMDSVAEKEINRIKTELHIRNDELKATCAKLDAARAEVERTWAALHQCYAATGEEAGDADDFRALVGRERITVEAVMEMRRERDQLAASRPTAEMVEACLHEIHAQAVANQEAAKRSPQCADWSNGVAVGFTSSAAIIAKHFNPNSKT